VRGTLKRSSFRNIVNDFFTMRAKAAAGSGRNVAAAALPEGEGPLTLAQRRYLARGLKESGGKLPLFDEDGREIPRRTIEACVAHGWAEPWISNPIKPDWLVCRLTPSGYRVLGKEPPRNRGRSGA
jgi:hypothetical protein